MDDRPSRRDDCRSDGPESMVTNMVRRELHKRHEPSADTGCAVPGLEKLRIQDLPIFEDSAEHHRAGLASHQFPRMKSSWFTPTRAGTCCPQMLFSRLSLTPIQRMGRSLLQMELPREVDLVGNVACDPISAVGGPRHQGASRKELHWSHNLHRALPGLSKMPNRFAALDENSRPEVHVMSEGADDAASTASDTESLACEPKVRRRRLSLVWDVGSNPHPANQSGESRQS